MAVFREHQSMLKEIPTPALIWTGLALIWVMLPATIIQYRLVVVPRRLQEVKDLFLHNRQFERISRDRGRSAAWHYAKLMDVDDPVNDQCERFTREFRAIHGWNRYVFPLIAVALISGL